MALLMPFAEIQSTQAACKARYLFHHIHSGVMVSEDNFLKFQEAKIPTGSEETQLGRNLGTLRANVDLIWSF